MNKNFSQMESLKNEFSKKNEYISELELENFDLKSILSKKKSNFFFRKTGFFISRKNYI